MIDHVNITDHVKWSDQIAMLQACAAFTDSGEWKGIFTYPNCGWDLVQSGLVTEDKKITISGRAALYLLNKGPDPFIESKSYTEVSIPIMGTEKK